MCGILGLVDLQITSENFKNFNRALTALSHRGPDHSNSWINEPVALGHTRLSIIDLDPRSHQPMIDTTGRYVLIYNGEIYNFRELRQECEGLGYQFKTASDSEVLLVLFMHYGEQCLPKLQGFFAFAIFDKKKDELFLARDRFGIKPLIYYINGNQFAFSSELDPLLKFELKRELDKVSMFTYFKFHYVPAPHTMLRNFHKLEAGCALRLKINAKSIELSDWTWYEVPFDPEEIITLNPHDYKQAQSVLKRFMRESVRKRLLADVPVGTFLSGGIDSSIITGIAAQEKTDIEAFSIGFSTRPYFDESQIAKRTANHFGIKHHTLDVSDNMMLEAANELLAKIDEPFADSSAINVYLLSQFASGHVKVALSGDGGDELFGGYRRHAAEFKLRNARLQEHVLGRLKPLWDLIPASRSGFVTDSARKLQKFADGYNLGLRDRYWRWAGMMTEEQANYLLREAMLERNQRLSDDGHEYKKRKDYLLRSIRKNGTLNQVLLADMQLVLPNDMLYKVDHMSMRHALEVRTPMLDHNVVKHAFKLPVMFKVNHNATKKILRDAYRDLLPAEVLNRPKKGFEVPLQEWFQGPMKSQITKLLDERDYVESQGLLNMDALDELKRKLFSRNPGDSPATAWSFMVFQSWCKKYLA